MAMRNFILAIMAACACQYAHVASANTPTANVADVVAVNCNKPDLTDEQRIQKSDLVFEGKIIDASCQCVPFDGDTTGAYQPTALCADTISIEKPIKGQLGATFSFEHYQFVNPALDVGEKKAECEAMVRKRDQGVIGKTDTYYLKKQKERYELVSNKACQP